VKEPQNTTTAQKGEQELGLLCPRCRKEVEEQLEPCSPSLAGWPGALPGELMTRITFMSAPEALTRTVEKHFRRCGKSLNHIFLCSQGSY